MPLLFVATLLGVISLVKLGITIVDMEFRGDSMTVLAWTKSNVTKGERATNAAVIFTMLCLKFGIDEKETCHISAKVNYRRDSLSRLKESGQEIISLMTDFGFEGDRNLRLERDIAVTSLIDCCSPNIVFTNESDLAIFWNSIRNSIENT